MCDKNILRYCSKCVFHDPTKFRMQIFSLSLPFPLPELSLRSYRHQLADDAQHAKDGKHAQKSMV
mgnify:CR=1 FL=1